MLVRLILLALAAYVIAVAFMYVFQRQFQYHGGSAPLPTPKEVGVPQMQEVTTKTEDGLNLQGWFIPPKESDGKIVILFHGNAGNISHRALKAAHFFEKGYGVYLAEYRGYGGNPGSPDEEGLYKDARAAVSFVQRKGYEASQLVFYGESIGTSVAIEMARRYQPPLLILEAPFTSTVDIAKLGYYWLPVGLLMKDRHDNLSRIAEVRSSLLIVHGDEDGLIPIALAQKLYETANHPKEFVTIYGGNHVDLYDHNAGYIVTEWLDRQVAEGR